MELVSNGACYRRLADLACQRQYIPARRPAEAIQNVVGVTGLSGLGKTELVQHTIKELDTRGVRALHVELDGFHLPRSERTERGIGRGTPEMTNWNALVGFLDRLLIKGRPAVLPRYNSATQRHEDGDLVEPVPVVFLEGVCTFLPDILPFLGLRVCLSAPEDLCHDLFIKTYTETRRNDRPDVAEAKWREEYANHRRFMEPLQKYADATVRVLSVRRDLALTAWT